ncbi:glucosamine-6-phosphate deaminase [Alkalihalobacillus trypoxylicola]|uniref:Glucosamine-6-phosphate deaminase n=1 Tax=Alkalihalobacillus trypoxylicola TaxID=519424 RepID=A0A161P658_9BACI|nr:glucosamine-6-phosphate deaminase [Alkalihalobacillus trypoxylicola]KYG27617.1 glucosamine-6-phosphate deaminase [Alkalihalobacillus trypoxylicola]
MKIIEVANYEEMSKAAAEIIIKTIHDNPKTVLGLATGGTPKGLYKELIHDYQEHKTDYSEMTSFNLDEYIGLSPDHPNSYYSYMNEVFFNYVNIKKENIHIPSGTNPSLEEECRNYEQTINNKGGIDIQILGIGENGHIGFNEPGTAFDTKTQVVQLAEMTREANSRYFNSLEDVPTKAITMGISTIMNAKQLILLVSGEKKAHALHQLLHSAVMESFPASILQTHKNVTIIADQDALRCSKTEETKGETEFVTTILD